MSERQDELVRIDSTGTAHPVGRAASRELRRRQGDMRLLPSAAHTIVLRATAVEVATAQGSRRPFWLSGEITRGGALWDLFSMFAQGNWTGELVVVDEDHDRRSIFVDRGAALGASSTAERERLGEVLYQYGALTSEQVQIVAEAVTPEVRFGEAAVALGFLAREKLFELIGKQTEEIVYAVMLVQSGAFYFVEGLDETRLSYRLNLPITSLLMEGVRRMDEMSCFRARIPSSMHVPTVVAGVATNVPHEHGAVLAMVDGHRSIDDIGRSLGAGQFETTRAVFRLLQQGLVTVSPPRPTGPQAIVALFNQAIALVLGKVDPTGGGREVREQLASFATASGVYDTLFRDAGPYADGTLDADRIAENVTIMVGASDDATSMLGQWLYEYASFAMFVAEPLLRARRVTIPGEQPTTESAAVSRQVAELLKPLVSDG